MKIQNLNNYELRFHIRLKRNGFKKINSNPIQHPIFFVEQPYVEPFFFDQLQNNIPFRFVDLNETTLIDIIRIYRYDVNINDWIPWNDYCIADNNHSWIQENLYSNFQGLSHDMELMVSAYIYTYPNDMNRTGLYITNILKIL